jgi:hypothetical protein
MKNQNQSDPRPIVRAEFDLLLEKLGKISRARINTERPYKINLVAQVYDHETADEIAVSLHQRLHANLQDIRFIIKYIEIGKKYVRFHIVPDWGYYIEQKKEIARSLPPDQLEMHDIIPI